MFKGGSLWIPPRKNLYTAGMPEDIFEESLKDKSSDYSKRQSSSKVATAAEKKKEEKKTKNNGLSDSQRDRFEDMLRNLLPDRNPVAETMVWCIEHAEAGEEIVDCITESLSILQTPLTKKIARLYLISDILHNCSVKGVPNVSYYRKGFQGKLPEVFSDLNQCYSNIESRIRAEAFKQRVMNCFRAWEDWALYPQDFLIRMQNIFLGFVPTNNLEAQISQENSEEEEASEDDDDVDGVPLDGAAFLKAKAKRTPASDDSDVDGVPLDLPNNVKKGPSNSKQSLPGFVPSKWETVDPEDVQAQAVTSKWDIFDQDEKKDELDEDDIDGIPMQDFDAAKMDELTRQRLRDIEVKVMCYQDDLESGKEILRPGWTISEQVEHFRKKLSAKKSVRDDDITPGRYDSDPDSSSRSSRSKKKKSRRRSSSSSRSRSRSRERSSRRSGHRSRTISGGSSSDENGSRRSSKKSNRRSRSRSRSPKRHKKQRRY